MRAAIDFSKYIKEEKDHGKHALYSPSGMDRTFGCPGSAKLIEKAPKGRVTDASKKGTNAHTLLEFMLREGESGLQVLKLKDSIEFKKHIGWTSEMQQATLAARAFIIGEYKALWRRTGTKPTLFIERKVHLDDIVDADCSGTSDAFLFVKGSELHVMDYKNGTYKVNAERNKQMLTYALGFLEEMGWDFPSIKLTIIQPHARTCENPSTTWQTTPRMMKDYKLSLVNAITKTKMKNAPLQPDSKLCFFCPANMICPAQKEKISNIVRDKF